MDLSRANEKEIKSYITTWVDEAYKVQITEDFKEAISFCNTKFEDWEWASFIYKKDGYANFSFQYEDAAIWFSQKFKGTIL